jgi:magnesium transporter
MPPSEHSSKDRPIGLLLAPDLLAALDEDRASVAAETAELHPADLADIAEEFPRDRVAELLAALPAERAADVLEYLDEELRSEVLEKMSAEEAAEIVGEMTPDDRADVLEALEDETAEDILEELEPEARRETEQLLEYAPDSAGGLMTTEFVSVPETMSVEDALASVRSVARSGRKEAIYAIYVTDTQGRIRGVLSLRELLAAPEGVPMSEVAWTEVRSVHPQADREEVSQLISEYDLVALPVVEQDGRLIGVITVDDVIDAIQEEQTEDVQKLGGMEAIEEPYLQTGFLRMIRKRAGWLCILFVGEMLTASAMGYYEHEIERAAILAIFLPLIISSGGNSGSQSTSLIIRAMALQEVRGRDWWRVAVRELPSGLTLGIILGLIGVARVVLWQQLGLYDYGAHFVPLAAAVGVALLGVVTFGTLAGSMLPFAMRRLGFDPASASAPFVATLVDVTGVVIYFSVALYFLRGTLL